MILCGKQDQSETSQASTPDTWSYAVLLMNPLSISTVHMVTRKMRKLDEGVISAYMALSMVIVFTVFSLAFGQDLSLICDFSPIDFVLLFFLGLFTIMSQTLRFMAIANHPLSGLQPYTFTMPL